MKMTTFLDMDPQFSELEQAQYVLLPVPYDKTSTFQKGADKGPQAILDASDSIELYDVVTENEAYTVGVYTDNFQYNFDTPEAMVQSVYDRVKYFLNQKKTVALLGGEHSISIGAIKAFSEKYHQLSVLQIDAHADLREQYHDSPYNHACVMRRAQEYGNVVQVGIRNVCSEEREYIVPENMFYAHEIKKNPNWIDQVISKLSDYVYLTIDLDGFDPSVVPATGTPLPGGLSWYEVNDLLEKLFTQRNVVAFDVVELCPQQDDKTSDVLAAVLVYRIISWMEKLRTKGIPKT
ncbi:MAG TPA: agmatinase [Bacteroidales bacterium]|nr:agmatinase [Bacteroidales bacterium]